jgi:Tol biopolymer transport system component
LETPLAETPTPDVTLEPTPTALGGGEAQVAFASNRTGQMQIWVINSDGKGMRQVTSMKDGACQPAWSPDGQRLVFISPCISKDLTYPGSSMYLINLDGSGLTPLPASPEGDFDPAWSPDGNKLAFTSLRTGKAAVHVIDLATLDTKKLSDSNYEERQPSWSPISRQLAFIRQIVWGQVWIMSDNGDQLNQFSISGDYNNYYPVWAWDGSVIFFNQTANNSNVPWLVGMRFEDRKTSREFRVPPISSADTGPVGKVSLSPDGFWFAYEGWPDGTNHDIYIMTLNGANRTRLTTDPAFDFGAAWRPVQ